MTNDAGDAAGIVYERMAPLTDNEPRQVAPGLFGLRFPLPFVLDHVNLWLVDDGDGLTLIDAGLSDQPTGERWQALWQGPLSDRSLTRVLVTHFHPDHMGLAGWLCEETGAELWASRTEWLQARLLAQDTSDHFVAAGRRFDHRVGLTETQIAERAARGNAYRPRVVPPPGRFKRLQHGDRLRIDNDEWQVFVGQGHAPEMLCLYSAQRNVLIAADQILPKISPNVSVWPAEPEANPLADFLSSLEPFRELPDDCLVLPSHGLPFRGLHERIDQLIAHHQERLHETIEACKTPLTTAEVIPFLFRRKMDSHQLVFAVGESLAHLNYLVEQGGIARRLDADGRLRYQTA